jgi:hypothetical protein
MKVSRSLAIKAAVGALVLAATSIASVAHAGGNVHFSIGANVAPGVAVAASNYPAYGYPYSYPYSTTIVTPAPVYVPAPVVVQAAPVIYPSPYYYGAPAVGVRYYYGPSYYGHGRGGHGGHWNGRHGGHNGHGGHGGHAGHSR